MPRPKTGYHLADGTRVPGVTTIAGRFSDKGGLMFWAFEQGKDGAETLYEKRDEAGDVGTFVHLMWEALLADKPAPAYPDAFSEEMKSQAAKCLDAALRWKEDSGLKITPLEVALVSEQYRYGGTPDALTTGNRGQGIADWKSGKNIYLETWLQMAAYRQLIQERMIPPRTLTDGIHVVRFGREGEFAHLHIPFDHPALDLAWEQFKCFIGAYERDKRLKKLT